MESDLKLLAPMCVGSLLKS